MSWEVQGTNQSRVARTLTNTTLDYKVTGLTSLTTYTLEVAAMTEAGVGIITSSTISSGVPPGTSVHLFSFVENALPYKVSQLGNVCSV